MSSEDLRILVENLELTPQPLPELSSTDELAALGKDVDGIVAQRAIEKRFNDAETLLRPHFRGPDISMERTPPMTDEALVSGALSGAMFVLDYSSRLIRSAMAVTGLSSAAERFGDIRKSQGFWLAMLDIEHTLANVLLFPDRGAELVEEKIGEKRKEQIKRIPEVLTRPSAEPLPGFGNLASNIGAPEKMAWMYDLVGELMIEANVVKATKRIASKAMPKLTKFAYEAGDELTKKKGIARLLGKLDSEELAAIDDAVKFRKVGKLGTKPPQGQIDDAIRKTFGYIDDTADARLTKQKIIKLKRKKGAARMFDVQGEGYGKGYHQRLRKAGATEVTEKSFVPFLDATDSVNVVDDYVTLQKVIDNYDFHGVKIYTTTNAQEALAKLYEYGELLTGGEVELLRDIFGNEFADSITKFVAKPIGVASKALNAGHKVLTGTSAMSRTMMTTGELSFLLRQGNFRAWTRPSEAIRSFVIAARALVSPKYAAHMDDAMRFSLRGKQATEAGLFLGRFGDDVTRLTQREEFFNAEWLRKVPVLGRLVKSFERGYVAGLNTIRLDWFDDGMQLLENAGKAGDDKLVKGWANYVNNMTGRASFESIKEADKAMKGMVKTAQAVLFAPRFTVSKWNRHKAAAELLFGANTPNSMRRLLVNDTVLKWRRYERLAHYAQQSKYEVEGDPRSSDFLKIKVGNTRFDVLGGEGQIQVLIARMATGETKETDTGFIKDKVATELAQQYLAGKLNPLFSLILDKTVGQTFKGEDIDDPKVLARTIRDKFIPLYFGDVVDKIFDGYEEEGKTVAEAIEGTASTVTLGFLGAGIQTYKPSARKEFEIIMNNTANREYNKDFADLPPEYKQDILWLVEAEGGDAMELLKEEMGMFVPTRATASRQQKKRNASRLRIRKGIGKDFKMFMDSNVQIQGFSRDIGDIRLNPEQQTFLENQFIKFIKQEMKFYPELSDLPDNDFNRRQWLRDIRDIARENAIDETLIIEP